MNIKHIDYSKNINQNEKTSKANHKNRCLLDEPNYDEFKCSKKEKNKSGFLTKIGGAVLTTIAMIALFKFGKSKVTKVIENTKNHSNSYEEMFGGLEKTTKGSKFGKKTSNKIRERISNQPTNSANLDNQFVTTGKPMSKPSAIAEIQNGVNGRVRTLNELNSTHLEQLISEQMKSVSVDDVQAFINSFPKSEQAFASRVMNKMSQHGNMQSIDNFADELSKYGNKLLQNESPSLTATLEYLKLSKGSLKNKNIHFSQTSGVCILDELTLQKLETNKAFLDKIKSNQDIIFATPEGWISGFNPFNQTTDYNKKFAEVIKEVGELMRSNPSLKENDAISAVLNKGVLERVEKLGINKRVNIVPNSNSIVGNNAIVSAEKIANQLNHTRLGADDIEAITSQFHSDYKPYINELLAHGLNINSPKAMSLKLQKMHEGILKLNGDKLDGIYYVVPRTGKSYSTVVMQYQIANGVPTSKVLTLNDLATLPNDAKKIVILDDVAGSGDSLIDVFNSVKSGLPQNHQIDDIIISPIVATKQAVEKIGHRSFNGKPLSIVAGEKCPSFTSSDYYKSLSKTDKMMIKKIMLGQGYGDSGLCIAFPYMSPDNNNYFFANYFANNFTLNGRGVKNEMSKSLNFKFLEQPANAA